MCWVLVDDSKPKMSIQDRFDEFHDAIQVLDTDDAYKAILKKDESILAEIKSAFKDEGYPVQRTLRLGSFAYECGTKRIDSEDLDLDRAIFIRTSDSPADPVKPKKIILDILEKRGIAGAKIKKPCVVADYVSAKMHIDYVVERETAGAGGADLALGTANSIETEKRWEYCESQALLDWLNDKENTCSTDELSQRRRHTKYLKRWRGNSYEKIENRKKIYSIGLAVMVAENYSSHFNEYGVPDDLESLILTVEAILDASYFQALDGGGYTIVVKLPTAPGRDIFHKHGKTVGTELHNKFSRLKRKLKEAQDASTEKEACKILREVFGDDFPDGEDAPKKQNKSPGIVTDNSGA